MDDKPQLEPLSQQTISVRPKRYWAFLLSYSFASISLLPVTLGLVPMQLASLILLALWLCLFILPKSKGSVGLKVAASGLFIALSISLFYQSDWVMPSGPSGALAVLLWPLLWLGVWLGPTLLALVTLVGVHFYLWVSYDDWRLYRLKQDSLKE